MPVVPFEPFIGAEYRSESVNVARSELINFYVEKTASPTDTAPFPASLLSTPGITTFASGMLAPIRGIFAQDGRVFCVGGSNLYELNGAGVATSLGRMKSDLSPATMASNGHGGHQLMVTSAGHSYLYDLALGTFGEINLSPVPSHAVMCDYLDGYFLASQATTSTFFISAVNNGTMWDPLDYGQTSSSSDALLAMRVVSRNVWLFGSVRTEIWVNQDPASTFPLAPIQPLVETGIAAPWSLAETAGSLCFVGSTTDGSAMVYQTQGYAVVPISTPSENRILSLLPDLFNIRGYAYQERGHTFYVLCPSTGPALVCDLTTGVWHRRGVWNAGADAYDPLHQWCHAYGFGKHLVGDQITGTVYEQSIDIGTDDGIPIRRVRTAPHVNAMQQYLFGSQVAIGCETGLRTNTGSAPTIDLSFSRDGGHSFSAPVSRSMGAQGDYRRLVKWNRTPGRFHDLVLRAVTTSSESVRLYSCELRIDPGTDQR
jgi:hypothetical protein